MSSDTKSKKPAAPKKPAEHPKYIEMIVAAITSLKERNGSSRQAIVKYIKANYKVGDNCGVHIKMGLKRGVASGALTQPKGTGASGSFKVVKKSEPKPKKPTKKATPKKPAGGKVAKKKKPAAAKKSTPAKKSAAKKSAAKKPVVKKPAAKKASKKTPTKKKATTKKKSATKKKAPKK